MRLPRDKPAGVPYGIEPLPSSRFYITRYNEYCQAIFYSPPAKSEKAAGSAALVHPPTILHICHPEQPSVQRSAMSS